MTTNEQHELIGKTILELSQAERKLAALRAKARVFAASMRTTAQELYPQRQIHTAESVADSLLNSGSDDYPERSEVIQLLEEIDATKALVVELECLATDMGAPPR